MGNNKSRRTAEQKSFSSSSTSSSSSSRNPQTTNTVADEQEDDDDDDYDDNNNDCDESFLMKGKLETFTEGEIPFREEAPLRETLTKSFTLDNRTEVVLKKIWSDCKWIHYQIPVIRSINHWKRVSHPNLVCYFGVVFDEEACWHWILLEYFPSKTALEVATKFGGLEEQVIASICCETLKALRYLHSVGLMHRKLTADHILISQRGEVKLTSFHFETDPLQLSVPIDWWAPLMSDSEMDEYYQPKSDVWRLGITTLQLAEVILPFICGASSSLDIVNNYFGSGKPRLRHPERQSFLLQDFIDRCLTVDAQHRPSAEELLSHELICAVKGTTVIVPFAMASFPSTGAALTIECAKCLAHNYHKQNLESLKGILPDELYILVQSEAIKKAGQMT